MVYTGIFATLAEVQAVVGANASSTYNAETYINYYMANAESYINVVCKYNFSDAYANLNADVKKILTRCASALAAIDVINSDLSGFQTKVEAQVRMDVLRDVAVQCLNELKEKDRQTYILGA